MLSDLALRQVLSRIFPAGSIAVTSVPGSLA
jgi:hypothetical protein